VVIGVLQVDLYLHGVLSLKQKRGVVQRILARCRNRFPVSAAEVGDQDLWQSARLGFVMVSSSEQVLAPVLQRLEDEIDGCADAELAGCQVEYIHY